MKRLLTTSAVLVLLMALPALAQKPSATTPRKPTTALNVSPGELTATPEMWFYEQARRQYEDPKTAVRAKAEFRADQRDRRLASSKWFGMSNARPRAGCDPLNSDYSPAWTSNNQFYPMRWTAVSPVIVRNESTGTRTY